MADNKKDELVRSLEEQAFQPVLNARSKGRSEAEQKRLEQVQRPRGPRSSAFAITASAKEVVINFRRDLEPAALLRSA